MSLAFTRLRVRLSPLLALTRLASALVVCRRVLTLDFHRAEIARGGETSGVQANSGVFAHNASIKVKRRMYVQRTSPSCNRECLTVTRVKETIKNVFM